MFFLYKVGHCIIISSARLRSIRTLKDQSLSLRFTLPRFVPFLVSRRSCLQILLLEEGWLHRAVNGPTRILRLIVRRGAPSGLHG